MAKPEPPAGKQHDYPYVQQLAKAFEAILLRFDKLELQNVRILKKEEIIMATIDQVLASVREETTLIDSISTLIDGIKTQLAECLVDAHLPAETQAKIDEVFTTAEANKAKLTAAVTANTPSAPQP